MIVYLLLIWSCITWFIPEKFRGKCAKWEAGVSWQTLSSYPFEESICWYHFKSKRKDAFSGWFRFWPTCEVIFMSCSFCEHFNSMWSGAIWFGWYQGDKGDPEKLRREREELELQKRKGLTFTINLTYANFLWIAEFRKGRAFPTFFFLKVLVVHH